tara:strand:+ start:72 stop:311 length:240 start_codon:yes stop_codon:yes gene_type:complete
MDGFLLWLASSMSIWLTAESLNCSYPYHNGSDSNEGIICQWEGEDFYYEPDSCKWILKEFDKDDNWFESISRKKYWKEK